MLKGKRRIIYGLYVVMAALFFSYYLFPDDTIKQYLMHKASSVNPVCQITIKRLSPHFPPGLLLNQVNLFYENRPLFNADEITLFPKWLSLFSASKAVQFEGVAYQGEISGMVSSVVSKSGRYPVLSATFNQLDLMAIPWLQERMMVDIAGTMTGKLRFEQKTIQERSGSVTAEIANCTIGLDNPLFDLEQLEFDEFNLAAILANSTLQIQQSFFSGYQMDGSLSGSIDLASQLENSRLKVNIIVKPNRVFLSNLPGMLSSFLSANGLKEKEELTIRVTGTIKNPKVMLQ